MPLLHLVRYDSRKGLCQECQDVVGDDGGQRRRQIEWVKRQIQATDARPVNQEVQPRGYPYHPYVRKVLLFSQCPFILLQPIWLIPTDGMPVSTILPQIYNFLH